MFWLTKLDQVVKYNPSICPKNCGRKFGGKNRKSNLKLHLLKECGKTVTCLICMKKFNTVSSLKCHLGIIHKVIYNY